MQVASFYPILRLLLPKSDNQRDSYGLRTNTLGKLFVKCLAINASSDDAKKLTYEKKTSGDFGDIVYEVMKNRSPAKGTLSVAEVNRYLDLMAEHFKNNERKRKCFINFWRFFFYAMKFFNHLLYLIKYTDSSLSKKD